MSAAAPISAKSMSTAMNRVDGRLKVTGAAKYAAEFNPPNMAYAFLIMSPIAKATITSVDSIAAEKSPGVLAVITHLNAPKLIEPSKDRSEGIDLGGETPAEIALEIVSEIQRVFAHGSGDSLRDRKISIHPAQCKISAR